MIIIKSYNNVLIPINYKYFIKFSILLKYVVAVVWITYRRERISLRFNRNIDNSFDNGNN